MSKTVAMAGMGWLGLPLARHLKTLGYSVKGSVTSEEKANSLRKNGFHAITMIVTEGGVTGPIQLLLADTDYLVIMIPPGLRRHTGADHVLKMSYLLSEIEKSSVRNVILVSSTSVYGDGQGMVTEQEVPKPETLAGKQLLQVEQLFFTSERLNTTIVRFGGLFGGSRQPVRYLAGRKDLSNGDAPVNLIHRSDCIGILTEIIKQEAFGHIFNAVLPSHPKKREYYSDIASKLDLVPPQYSEGDSEEIFKQVDSVNLDTILDYSFKHSL
ncbi:MAG: NAD(P)H-binding protein [Bacteroidia bacterium]|nr:NAD(P)H-binding protein [Bacteroidia bacterium]NNF30977.1 NAD(P)H-binding protein [Flavobacteriaceae bacterium]MBT8274939.1 NAD(P)H-binding protein [Bacteroidia bacterium]NNJ82622.1 NAD(P)H-binding protein [Flavobacteriaceae bacterium]NNK53136.1 NAD(P)H-binding protein [Flavobacteriaceae bacterium]